MKRADREPVSKQKQELSIQLNSLALPSVELKNELRMKDRCNSLNNIASIKRGHNKKKRRGTVIGLIRTGSSLTDRNNISLGSSSQPPLSKFQLEKQPIPRKNKKPQKDLPPRNHTGLGLAFPKVNNPTQRSNITEEIDDSSDEDIWRYKQNKKKIYNKKFHRKKI